MRNPSIPIGLTGLLGSVALVLGLVPASAGTAALPTRPAVPRHVAASSRQASAASDEQAAPAAIEQVQARLVTLEREADDAGRVAQTADEALVRRSDRRTRAAAHRAQAALRALSVRQTPELSRLARRLDALGAAGGDDAVPTTTTAVAVALRGRTKALRAVSFAREQLGDPYRFAGTGAGGFDCSGLTMRSYDVVRVGIGGHGATAQWRKAARQHRLVPYRHRHRGDLIFYGRPGAVYHVAIYSGHGRMIEAPYPGKRVREVPVRSWDRLAQVARPTR